MLNIVMIALCGGLGCLGRHFIGDWVHGWVGGIFPYGTLVANVVGAFIIGVLMEFGLYSTLIPASLRTGLTVGFLGGLTTFSTFSYQTFRLLQGGHILAGVINALGSVFCGILSVWVGIALTRAILVKERDHDQIHG